MIDVPDAVAIFIGLAAWTILLLGHEPWYLVDDSARTCIDAKFKLRQYKICKIICHFCLAFLCAGLVIDYLIPELLKYTFLVYISGFVLVVFYSLFFFIGFLLFVYGIYMVERTFIRYE